MFGHLNEGNLHVNVLGADDARRGGRPTRCCSCVAACGGSISSEHGVGPGEGPRGSSLSRSPAEIAAMRRIKAALDPHGLLNPGVLLPLTGATSAADRIGRPGQAGHPASSTSDNVALVLVRPGRRTTEPVVGVCPFRLRVWARTGRVAHRCPVPGESCSRAW